LLTGVRFSYARDGGSCGGVKGSGKKRKQINERPRPSARKTSYRFHFSGIHLLAPVVRIIIIIIIVYRNIVMSPGRINAKKFVGLCKTFAGFDALVSVLKFWIGKLCFSRTDTGTTFRSRNVPYFFIKNTRATADLIDRRFFLLFVARRTLRTAAAAPEQTERCS